MNVKNVSPHGESPNLALQRRDLGLVLVDLLHQAFPFLEVPPLVFVDQEPEQTVINAVLSGKSLEGAFPGR